MSRENRDLLSTEKAYLVFKECARKDDGSYGSEIAKKYDKDVAWISLNIIGRDDEFKGIK